MSRHPDIATTGFRVVEEYSERGVVRYRPLSRVYHAKDAAEEFADLARRSGHPGAYVNEVKGPSIR